MEDGELKGAMKEGVTKEMEHKLYKECWGQNKLQRDRLESSCQNI